MNHAKQTRIAWVYPSISFGAYWQPIISEFAKTFDKAVFYTGCLWPEFDSSTPGASRFRVIGKSKYVRSNAVEGYARGFIYASPGIVLYLLKFRPKVIFASAFSIWTVLVLLLKPICRWRVAIMYDGSSPNSDFQDSKFRSTARKLLARFADAFIANSNAAKVYLHKALEVPENRIFTKTYLVPDATALLQKTENVQPVAFDTQGTIFLFVGQVIARKGIKVLLKACAVLRQEGYTDFTLIIVGDGAQRQELEMFVCEQQLQQQVVWVGWVQYGQLGTYFQRADVFVLPTFEDVWGMSVLEAMVFGKPILCSTGANASEMVTDGINGYLFQPDDVAALANEMRRFINDPSLGDQMGRNSKKIIANYTPETAAQAFAEVASFVIGCSSEKALLTTTSNISQPKATVSRVE
jgi:glycosyltransferase involved in cell wall biosynthesis